jgi:hypothetical protein
MKIFKYIYKENPIPYELSMEEMGKNFRKVV